MDELKAKVYEVTITGELVLDPTTKLPKKDAEGNVQYVWIRLGKETADTAKFKLKPGRFIQTSMLPFATENTTMTLPNGKTITVGASDAKGMTVNVWENARPEIFNMINSALEAEIAAGKLNIIKKATEEVRPVCKLSSLGQPGYVQDYMTDFDFYQHQIDPADHIEKATKSPSYDRKTGKMDYRQTVTNRGRVFLFPYEFAIAEAIVETQMKEDYEFKVPEPKHTREGGEDFKVVESEPAVTPATPPVTPPVTS
jgi:hypothetical protein